jgi:hypothetical protein
MEEVFCKFWLCHILLMGSEGWYGFLCAESHAASGNESEKMF